MAGHFDSDEDLGINRPNFEYSLKQNRLLSDLLESSEQPFVVGYTDGSLGYVNRSFEELTGYTQEELKKLDWLTILTPPEFRDMEQEKLEELQRTGQPVRYEKEYIRKDGTRVPIELLVHLMRNEDGTPQYYYSFITNITERKQAEDVLRDSEKRYLQFFDNPLNGFALCEIITDDKRKPVDFIYLEVNEAFEDFTGLKREEVINKRVKEIFPPEEVDELIKIYGNVALTGESDHFEYPIPSLDKYYDVAAFSPQKMRFIAFFTDITERKLAEDALQRSEERYRSILDNIQDAYMRGNNEGVITMVSPSAARMYGFDSPEEMIGVPNISLYKNPEDRNYVLDELKKHGKLEDYESEGLRTDATSFSVSMNAQFHYDDHGQIQGTEAFVRDITNRKKAEENLQYANERLNVASRAAKAGLWDWDIKTGHIEWTPMMFELLGIDSQKTNASFEAWGRALHPEDVQIANQRIEKAVNEHKFLDSEYRIIKPDGQIRWINALGETNYDEEGNPLWMTGICIDITERKQAEEQVEQRTDELAKSNADLKQFAYVASHDLREPLRMISSFLQLLERRYQDQLDDDANEFIGFAVDGAKRLDTMIMDLLKYSRVANKEIQFTNVDLEEIIDRVVSNLNVLIEENSAQITCDQLPIIQGDENQMIILFQNLISNAIKYRQDETPQVNVSAEKDSDNYVFSVKDNGIGIDPKHLERIFTIFQRLHPHQEYEGSGIGLSIAQRIVHQHGGEIWAESEPGNGSTFNFTIPI